MRERKEGGEGGLVEIDEKGEERRGGSEGKKGGSSAEK